jgi:hypothetical protein
MFDDSGQTKEGRGDCSCASHCPNSMGLSLPPCLCDLSIARCSWCSLHECASTSLIWYGKVDDLGPFEVDMLGLCCRWCPQSHPQGAAKLPLVSGAMEFTRKGQMAHMRACMMLSDIRNMGKTLHLQYVALSRVYA